MFQQTGKLKYSGVHNSPFNLVIAFIHGHIGCRCALYMVFPQLIDISQGKSGYMENENKTTMPSRFS